MYTFGRCLQKDVIVKLSKLNEFVDRLSKGLQENVDEEQLKAGDSSSLLRIMGYIRDIRVASIHRVPDMFTGLKSEIELLKKRGMAVESMKVKALPAISEWIANGEADDIFTVEDGAFTIEAFMEEAPGMWSKLVDNQFKKMSEILKYKDMEKSSIKKTNEAFYVSLRDFYLDFRNHGPFSAEGLSPEEAYEQMATIKKKTDEFDKEIVHRNELQDLFELTIENYSETKEVRRFLSPRWPAAVHTMFLLCISY